jgi:hypothetical protein
MRIKRIVALITVTLLLVGCAALKPPSDKPDDANALYLQNRCLGGVGDPGPCFDNPGLPLSGGGPGFTSTAGVAR